MIHWTQIVGAVFLVSLFIGLFVFIARETSLWDAFGVFGVTLAIITIVGVGVALVSGAAA